MIKGNFRYLLNENYYWLFKKFVIFDVDRKLNIHLIFMSVADVAREYGISQTRLNAIIAVNKPIEKFKLEQDLNIHVLQEEFDQFVQDDFAKEQNGV